MARAYFDLDTHLHHRAQWPGTKAKVHHGSEELVQGCVGFTDRRLDI